MCDQAMYGKAREISFPPVYTATFSSGLCVLMVFARDIGNYFHM